jgi:hypothetical protein
VGNLETFQKSSYGVKTDYAVTTDYIEPAAMREPLASYGVSISDLIATGFVGGIKGARQFFAASVLLVRCEPRCRRVDPISAMIIFENDYPG